MFTQEFPKLLEINQTSEATQTYNCIAWALGLSDRWWWPSNRATWHPDVVRENTIDAFTTMFSKFGYLPCDAEYQEMGKEKIALFCLDGKPTHAARLLQNGYWTSKLGPNIDISHSLRDLEGPAYGSVEQVYSRILAP